MNKLWLAIIAFLILGASSVLASSDFETTPGRYYTSPSQAINFSAIFNNSDDGNVTFNVTVYNASTPNGPFSILINGTLNNNTMWNFTKNLKNNERYWFYFNITNKTVPAISQINVLDIDTSAYISSFSNVDPVINLTLGPSIGTIVARTNISAPSIIAEKNITAPRFFIGALMIRNDSLYNGTTANLAVLGINTTNPAHTLTVQGTLNVTPAGKSNSSLFIDSRGVVAINTSSPVNKAFVVNGEFNLTFANGCGISTNATCIMMTCAGDESTTQTLAVCPS